MTWAHLIDELAAGQPLSESEAETLFAAMFDGGVPDLELGGLLALIEQRPLSQQELVGVMAALSTRVFQLAAPDTQWRPVLMPSYGGLREQPNLLPLLAQSLQRLGIPVLVHGMLSGERGVAAAYILREMGVMPCASLAQAQQELQAGHLAFVPTGALAPALADLLAMRVRLGGGAYARVLARLADPFGGAALQLLPAEHAQERAVLRSLLCDVEKNALLFETRDGDPVVDAQCRPGIELVRDGTVRQLFDAEVTPRCAHPLPAAQDLKGTARWISGVLEGRIPMPVPIANQFACCLYGTGYAQDINQAKAIAAVETGSLAAA
ncbi:MAG: DNA-binding protein YbiB [Burkholderiales bacterium]|nr:DNA-binding protein YbiB [Burkholderiales bacterium]